MVSDKLKERVKELSCLYDMSKIARCSNLSVEEVLQQTVNRIAKAFQYDLEAICELIYGTFKYVSKDLPKTTVVIQKGVFIDNNEIGQLRIHYPSDRFKTSDFLEEEYFLLEKLAIDISDVIEKNKIKKLEAEYIQKFVRQDRLTVLEEITASIAHELNTPLANIYGFAEFIIQSNANNQTSRDAQKILNSAIHASEIVKKLMYFSCELPQKFNQISLQNVVEETLQLLQPVIERSNLRVVFNGNLSEADLLFADAVQLTQVIFNLVSNAISASKKNLLITVNLWKDEENMYLEVCDQGTGIDKENLARIFEPFFSTKDVGEGMGLGLSVVHGIVRAHGGEVKVESEIGIGTRFIIVLPIEKRL